MRMSDFVWVGVHIEKNNKFYAEMKCGILRIVKRKERKDMKKTKSKKKVWIILKVFLLVVVCSSGYLLFRYQNTSYKRLPNRYQGNIAQVFSAVDRDGDGIDDQTDILQGALGYIATQPEYKSKYYSTGYSNDQYGVCTDVVAHALRNAGYDLMILLQEDLQTNPYGYAIDIPDINIDFRRVRNLDVYFSHDAISLTTDVYAIDQWQGGDIVVFNNHVGIVSDHRNEKGVPYIIHHNGPWQPQYEQDILENRTDIIGHYRMSQ